MLVFGITKILAAFMSMPEASIDKHARAVLAQHYVRMTGQPWIVQSVAEALSPQIFAHKYLRLSVLGTNRSHVLVPLLWCMYIHAAKIRKLSEINKVIPILF